MSELYLMTAIITRDRTKDFAAFYDRYGVPVNFITLGNGTANNELLDYFGLDGTEKAVIFSVVTRKTWKKSGPVWNGKCRLTFPARALPLSSLWPASAVLRRYVS